MAVGREKILHRILNHCIRQHTYVQRQKTMSCEKNNRLYRNVSGKAEDILIHEGSY